MGSRFSWTLLLAAAVATAAAGPASAGAPPDALFTVTYRFPKDCHLSRFMEWEGERDGATALTVRMSEDSTELMKARGTFADGSNDIRKGSKFGFIRYTLNSSLDLTAEGSQAFQVWAVQKSKFRPADLLIWLYEVQDFPVAEAVEYLANAARLECTVEVNAQYSPESIRANFVRQASLFTGARVRGVHSKFSTVNRGPEWRKAFDRQLNVFVVGTTPILYSVEVFPYRNGSKVVARAMIPADASAGLEVNFLPLVEAFRNRIEQVSQD